MDRELPYMVATTRQWFPGEWCHLCWAFSLLGVRRLKYCTFVSYQLYLIFVLCQGIKSLCLQLFFSIRCEDIKRLSFNILHSFLGVLSLFWGSGSDLISLSFYILHFCKNFFNKIFRNQRILGDFLTRSYLPPPDYTSLWNQSESSFTTIAENSRPMKKFDFKILTLPPGRQDLSRNFSLGGGWGLGWPKKVQVISTL